METPTFCKDFIFNNVSCSFSTAFENIGKKKVKESRLLKNLKKNGRNKFKKKSEFGKNSTDKKNKKRRNHHSCKFRTKKYDINNINEFIKKHKFKLRNDFDKKHVENFLSSKEQAFNMSFLFFEEHSSTVMKS